MEGTTGKNNRLKNGTVFILLILAILADLLTLIPAVGIIVGPVFWTLLNIYLWKSGLGMRNGRLVTGAVSSIAEAIPFIQALPTITLGVLIIVVMSRIEDRAGISLSSMASGPHLNSGGFRKPTPVQAPMNKSGNRAPNGGLS